MNYNRAKVNITIEKRFNLRKISIIGIQNCNFMDFRDNFGSFLYNSHIFAIARKSSWSNGYKRCKRLYIFYSFNAILSYGFQ